jgi:hypothetical protein
MMVMKHCGSTFSQEAKSLEIGHGIFSDGGLR